MKVKPLRGRVLIEPIQNDPKKKGGIILPETVDKGRPEKGKIVSLGPEMLDESGKKIPFEVKKGDVVLFTKYGPQELKVDDKDYLIAEEKDILAIIS